jgi:PAS domain S-box-containing protein
MNISDLASFYAARLEDMPEPALIMTHGGDVLFTNAALRRAAEAPDTGFGPHDPVASIAEAVRDWGKQTDHGPPVCEFRLRVILPDGAGTRHINWKCAAVPARDGTAVLAWGTFRSTGPGREMGFTVLPSGVIRAASPALCELCGYTRDELTGRPARQFYYTASSRRRIVNQLNERSEVENGAVTLRHKNGSPLTLWYSAETIRDRDGKILAYSGFFQQRPFPFSTKLASEFTHIVDALPDLAWVCGRDLRIVAANQAYLQAYGRTREEVVGRSEYDFLDPGQARFPIEAAIKVFEEKQELLHPAVPHLIDPKVWYRVIRRPIFDDDHQEVIGLLGIAQDISARVIQENAFMEQLRAREEDVVVVTDDQGRILRRSAQTLTPSIYGRPEAFDAYTLDMRPVLELLHDEDLPKVRQAMHTALREHREQHLECRIRNQTGGYSTVLARLVYHDAIYGEPRMYAVVRDISGRQELRTAPMVIRRLREAAGARTDRELSMFLNVSAAAISNARKNGRVPADWIIDTGLRTGRSLDWLACGTSGNAG